MRPFIMFPTTLEYNEKPVIGAEQVHKWSEKMALRPAATNEVILHEMKAARNSRGFFYASLRR